MKDQSRRPTERAASERRSIVIGCAVVLLSAAGCARDPIEKKLPPIEVEEPLSPEALRKSFQPDWERGTTWMVRAHCDPGWPVSLPYVSPLLNEWPIYSYFEVEAATPDAFVLSRTVLPEVASDAAKANESKAERFLVRREPFGLADKRPRRSDDADLRTVEDPWTLGPCFGSNRRDVSCPLLPAVPDAGQDAAAWLVHQAVRRTDSGIQFFYWEDGAWPSSMEWRSGEPYWEDSFGCIRLVRNLDGSVYRPRSPADVPTTEPAVSRIPNRRPSVSTRPPSDSESWEQLISPRWKVGDRWVTQHRCPRLRRTYARDGAWVFGLPPHAGVGLMTLSFYEVIEETDDAFVIMEGATTWRGASLRLIAEVYRESPYQGRSLFHVFRKRPFGIVRWWDRDLMAEYGGGPCLNVGTNVDRCPFPVPADPPTDGRQPSSWVAKQTASRITDALELKCVSPDKTELTIRWKDDEPWPKATPSCTKLLRMPDGSVLRPGDDVHTFLGDWAQSAEAREEMRALDEWRPSKKREP